jgi:hypothetical protein
MKIESQGPADASFRAAVWIQVPSPEPLHQSFNCGKFFIVFILNKTYDPEWPLHSSFAIVAIAVVIINVAMLDHWVRTRHTT